MPPAGVTPLSMLKADVFVYADMLEPHRLMQPDARFIRQGDTGIGAVKALHFQNRDQPFVQRPSHTAPARVFCDIGGDIDRPAIGGSVAMYAGIGIAEDPAFP